MPRNANAIATTGVINPRNAYGIYCTVATPKVVAIKIPFEFQGMSAAHMVPVSSKLLDNTFLSMFRSSYAGPKVLK